MKSRKKIFILYIKLNIIDCSTEEQKWATILSNFKNINSSLHQVETSTTAVENLISSLKTYISEQLSTVTTYYSYLQSICTTAATTTTPTAIGK